MKCPKCNLELPDDSFFCQYCGTDILTYIQVKESLPDMKATANGYPNNSNLYKRFDIASGRKNQAINQKHLILGVCIMIISLLIASEIYQTIQMQSLQKNIENYNEIICFIQNENNGYASDNFKTNENLIFVHLGEKDKKITLTAHWNQDASVLISQQNTESPAAHIEFDEESWKETTSLTIYPNHKGISTFTFSNDFDDSTFKIMVIVVD